MPVLPVVALARRRRHCRPRRADLPLACGERPRCRRQPTERPLPSKGTLALDAYLEDMRDKVVVPDTGDGGEDLRRHARAVIRFYTGVEGRIFAQFMAEAQSDPRSLSIPGSCYFARL